MRCRPHSEGCDVALEAQCKYLSGSLIKYRSPHRAALDTSEQIGELHQIMKYNGAEVKLKIYKTVVLFSEKYINLRHLNIINK